MTSQAISPYAGSSQTPCGLRTTHGGKDLRLVPVDWAVEHGIEVEYAGGVGWQPMVSNLQRLLARACCSKSSHRKHPHGLLQQYAASSASSRPAA